MLFDGEIKFPRSMNAFGYTSLFSIKPLNTFSNFVNVDVSSSHMSDKITKLHSLASSVFSYSVKTFLILSSKLSSKKSTFENVDSVFFLSSIGGCNNCFTLNTSKPLINSPTAMTIEHSVKIPLFKH